MILLIILFDLYLLFTFALRLVRFFALNVPRRNVMVKPLDLKCVIILCSLLNRGYQERYLFSMYYTRCLVHIYCQVMV